MKQIPLARAGMVTPIIKFLYEIGTPIDLHLSQVNIPRAALDDSETLIALLMLLKFIANIAGAEGIESFGIVVGKKAKSRIQECLVILSVSL